MNDLDVVGPVVEATLSRLGITLPSGRHPLAARAALQGLAAAHREDARRERGVYLDPPEQDVTLASPPISAPLAPAVILEAPAPEAVAPPPPAEPPSPLLSEEVEVAKRRRLRANGDAKTLRDMDLAVRLFQELVGDLRVGEMRWTDVASFRDQALALPKWHRKGLFDSLSAPQRSSSRTPSTRRTRRLSPNSLGPSGRQAPCLCGPSSDSARRCSTST